jgi:hypothetical protein
MTVTFNTVYCHSNILWSQLAKTIMPAFRDMTPCILVYVHSIYTAAYSRTPDSTSASDLAHEIYTGQRVSKLPDELRSTFRYMGSLHPTFLVIWASFIITSVLTHHFETLGETTGIYTHTLSIVVGKFHFTVCIEGNEKGVEVTYSSTHSRPWR